MQTPSQAHAPWPQSRPTLFGWRLPEPPDIPVALAASAQSDLAACRTSLRNGSKTFLAASMLLPRGVCEPAAALYAFCRLADDAVDAQGDRSQAVQGLREQGGAVQSLRDQTGAVRSLRDQTGAVQPLRDQTGAVQSLRDQTGAVQSLRDRVRMAYAAKPLDNPADRALAVVVARHAIPQALFDALLEGFEWDLQGRRYDTLEALHDYGARVAGTVGAMMALLMGVRSADGLARACDLGVAMQLSNIARDVGEDARMGRLYLPRQWMLEAGIDPDAWLAKPTFTPALGRVVRRLLDAADALYSRVDAGVARLPLACRPGINAARFIYAEIGHEVARRGLDSVSGRARVSGARKGLLLVRSVAHVAFLAPRGGRTPVPVLPANRFLVDAATATAGRTPDAPRRKLAERVVWTAELFARLQQREHLRNAAQAGQAEIAA